MVFNKIKKALTRNQSEDFDQDYLEIDVGEHEKEENKVIVKLFSLKQYEDVTGILNALREGYTIAIIDIKHLKKRDSIELKRAISKIKKTADALEGSIAGFENVVIVTPSFAKIQKDIEKQKEYKSNFETY
jgi:SepF-like predicted cell division protein (DUF552 family)